MAESETEKDLTWFTHTLVYRRNARWPEVDAAAAAEAIRSALGRHRDVIVRGIYSAAGLRPDADIAIWLLAHDVPAIQAVAADLRRTALGTACDLTYAFLGVARRPEFVGDHLTAFQMGKGPLGFLCLYPFVRTPEWYLIPDPERGKMLRDHGAMGREFPEVQSNNVAAFGLGDWEWLLHFESDRPERFTALIRNLRSAEARRYTRSEVPFILARRVEAVEEALADLG